MSKNRHSRPSPSLSYAALQRLQVITSEILGRLDLEQLLDSILTGAVELLEGDHAQLYRYDNAADELRPWIPHDMPQVDSVINYARGFGAVGTVLATGKTLLIDAYDNWDRRIPDWPEGVTGSVVATEIRARDELLGVISVNRRPGEPEYGRASADLLELFAGQAAIAISNAQMYEAERRSAEEMSRIYETSLEVARELNLERALEAIMGRATELMSARSANVRIFDEESGELVPLLPYRQPDAIAQIRLKPGQGVSGLAYAAGEPVFVNDYENWEGKPPGYPKGLIARGLAAPLIHGDEITGVIALDRAAGSPPFDDNDVRLLSLFANQAAIVIANAQLYDQSQRRGRELQHAFETSLDITGRLDLEQVLEALIQRTAELVDAVEGEVIVVDPETGLVTSFMNLGLDFLAAPQHVHQIGQPPHGLDGMVIEQGQPVQVDDYDSFAQRLESLPKGVAGPMVGIPIIHQGQVLGSLSLFRDVGKPPFTAGDIRRLSLFANQAAVAIANARQVAELSQLHEQQIEKERLDQQLRMASAVQTGFLPVELPELEAVDIAAYWVPAQQIGGDFYDLIPLQDGRWGIVIADVSDKGIPAALFMSMTRSLFRAFAGGGDGPDGVLHAVNQEMIRSTHSGMFVTALYAELDPATRRLALANGGHNPALLLRQRSKLGEWIKIPGMALGILKTAQYETHQIELQPGDRMLFYTDGLTEAINNQDEEFGTERLLAWISRTRRRACQRALADLRQTLDAFCQDRPPFDDQTCVLLGCHR